MAGVSKHVEASDSSELPKPGPPVGTKAKNPPSSQVEVDLAAQSHVGNVKTNNEDHYIAVRLKRNLHRELSNLPEGVVPLSVDETAYEMAVAGGIGGMPAGALASSLALQELVDLLVKSPDWIMRMSGRKAAVVKRRLTERFRQIDEALREHSASDPRLAGMGTTMTVACSMGSDLFLAHIGDSRAYLLRNNELHQLTRDHTLAQALIEAGVAEAEEETVYGMRRVLTAALGSTPQPAEPEVQRLFLRHGDQLLLCTDGLAEYVDSQTICSVLRCAESADEACHRLIDAALTHGGNDNVTVVLARYRFPQAAPES